MLPGVSEVRVFECPGCGAPLPAAADGEHVTCAYCRKATVIDYSGAAMVREQASRREAEALYATLGQPPSWSQRVAVVLTNGWLWLFGMPFMLALLLRIAAVPRQAIDAAWEASRHERLHHVAAPLLGWLLDVGWPAGAILFLLVWSLFGERIDARRDLQAALASKPPRTEGGPSVCRQCDAALEVAPGALGARCAFCGADNLVQVPAAWIKRAARLDVKLRLSAGVARERAKEGARRVRRAARWRLPCVLIVLAIVSLPTAKVARRATWASMRYDAKARVGIYELATWRDHEAPAGSLRSFAACDDAHAREKLLRDSRLATDSSRWCLDIGCTGVAMVPLAKGERLRLAWLTSEHASVRVALGPRDYAGGVAVLWDGFGEEIAATTLPDGTLEYPAAISGWYKVQLRGTPGVAVEPCVVAAP